MAKITVIAPIYNTEKYLKECIESVLNQSFSDFELVLVNDGSPDNSEAICLEYLKDSRVKYYRKENEGVAIARNYGISKAVGDYIFCLDSDDTIESTFLEKLANNIDRFTPELIIIGKHFIREKTNLIGALPTWAFAVKRDVLEKYPKIRFVEKIQPCEDGLFSHMLLALTKKISFCSDAVYNYRQHSTSSESRLNGTKIINDIPRWFEILEQFYDEYNLCSDYKNNLLAFIYNEPYGLRFLNPELKLKEKKAIFNLVQNFVKKHDLYLKNKDFNLDFKLFINSKNFITYRLKSKISSRTRKLNKYKTLKIAYCWQCPNVGDDFNTFLLRKLKIRYKRVEYSKCDTLLVGSNLDNIIVKQDYRNPKQSNDVVNVIGTGFIEKAKGAEKAIRQANILAVRGKLSLNRITHLNNITVSEPILGDLGILASNIYPVQCNYEKDYDLGIIPHYNDKNCDLLLNNINLQKYNFKFIDVQQDCASFFQEINKCRCIFSSSLHGLIFSDSYNIPNIQILLSDNVYGDNYKFKDYYSAYDIEYPAPLDLRQRIVTDKLVDSVIAEYQSKKDLIDAKSYELLKILKSL